MRPPATRFEAAVRREAFRLLLVRAEPLATREIAQSLGSPPDQVAQAVTGLSGAGRVRVDDGGRIVGSAGLSVTPDRHDIEIRGRAYWTWCAYDILGIFGALEADGIARTTSPASGARLELTFRSGLPDDTDLILVLPEDTSSACCTNVYTEWCPNSNLFEDQGTARAWMEEHRVTGEVLPLQEAALQARREWRPLVDGLTLPPG